VRNYESRLRLGDRFRLLHELPEDLEGVNLATAPHFFRNCAF